MILAAGYMGKDIEGVIPAAGYPRKRVEGPESRIGNTCGVRYNLALSVMHNAATPHTTMSGPSASVGMTQDY
jgi:hypothetical protein